MNEESIRELILASMDFWQLQDLDAIPSVNYEIMANDIAQRISEQHKKEIDEAVELLRYSYAWLKYPNLSHVLTTKTVVNRIRDFLAAHQKDKE